MLGFVSGAELVYFVTTEAYDKIIDGLDIIISLSSFQWKIESSDRLIFTVKNAIYGMVQF
jgi:hypothetical protein